MKLTIRIANFGDIDILTGLFRKSKVKYKRNQRNDRFLFNHGG